MNQIDRALLDQSVDKTVRLTLHGGEIVTAKILHIDLEYSDVIYDVLETNKPELYTKPLNSCAFVTPLEFIDGVQRIGTA
jgi:hypothetical protein